MELGCSLHWTKGSLKLTHPKHGRLKVSLKGRCPELAVTDALKLIQELEDKELKHLQVEIMTAHLNELADQDRRGWRDFLKHYIASGKKDTFWKFVNRCPYTKDLPEEVKELLIEGHVSMNKRLPPHVQTRDSVLIVRGSGRFGHYSFFGTMEQHAERSTWRSSKHIIHFTSAGTRKKSR